MLHCIDGAEQTENLPQIKAPSLNIKSLNTTTDLIQDIAKIVGTSASSIIGSVGAVSDAIGSTGRITDTGINGYGHYYRLISWFYELINMKWWNIVENF